MSRAELVALLMTREDELRASKVAEGVARDDAVQANAHAAIAGQQFADLQREQNSKVKSHSRGALKTGAWVVNSVEEVARIEAERAEKQKWDEAKAEHKALLMSSPLWAGLAGSIESARAQFCDCRKAAVG